MTRTLMCNAVTCSLLWSLNDVTFLQLHPGNVTFTSSLIRAVMLTTTTTFSTNQSSNKESIIIFLIPEQEYMNNSAALHVSSYRAVIQDECGFE